MHAHLAGEDANGIIQPERFLSLVGDWRAYLDEAQAQTDCLFVQHERTGRPLDAESFVEKAEHLLQRTLKKKKPGPKNELERADIN